MAEDDTQVKLATRLQSLMSVLSIASDKPDDISSIIEIGLTTALGEGHLADAGSVYLATPIGKTDELRFEAKVKRAVDGDLEVIRDPNRRFKKWERGVGIAGLALERKMPVICNDPANDNSYVKFGTGHELQSLMAVPLAFDGKVFGVMSIHNAAAPVEFEESDVQFVEAICNAITLSFIANYSDLTRLPNRRLMDHLLKQEIEQALKSSGELSLVLMDLDDFRTLNKKFGWQRADQAIVQFSQIVTEAVGEDGIACHRHGDEFAILFRRNATVAAAMAQSILYKVRNYEFDIDGSKCGLTTSMGLSSLKLGSETQEIGVYAQELMDSAEDASERAKHEFNKDCLYVENKEKARR